jgi:hypothetical protein
MMLYSIQEVAKQLKVTRMTVYKKIDSIKDFSKYIKVQEGIKYVNELGVEVLRKSIKKLQNDMGINDLINNEVKGNINDIHIKVNKDTNGCIQDDRFEEMRRFTEFNKYTDLQEKFNEGLQRQILDLKNQLEVKDKQLEIKDRQIESLTDALGTSQKLNENNQVLLRESQQKIKFLEECKAESENKKDESNLVELVKTLQSHVENLEKESQKGFFARIFR